VFLFSLVVLGAPRVALALMWILGDRVESAFDTALWPVLGLVFLPLATIMYVLVWDPFVAVSTSEWLVVGVAAAVDVISWTSRLARVSRPYG
jgi:hypothetical protein